MNATTKELPALSDEARAFCLMMRNIIAGLRDYPARPELGSLEIMYRVVENGQPGVLHQTHVLEGMAEPDDLKKLVDSGLSVKCLAAGGIETGCFQYLRLSIKGGRLESRISSRSLEPRWLAPRLIAFSSTVLRKPNIRLSYGPFSA